jgi:hypothetical protein
LEHNLIEKIQPIHSVGVFSITKLWLNDNRLVTITELCNLKNLTVLSLANNLDLNFEHFYFNCWSELKTLHLQNTNLVKLKHDYRLFAGLLTFLNLKKNNLEYFCVVNFPELSALESLFIDDNKLKQLNGTALITKFRSIKSISMFGNSWDCAVVRDLNNTNVVMVFESDFKCINSALAEQVKESEECELSKPSFSTLKSEKSYLNKTNKESSIFFTIFVGCTFFASTTIDFVISYLVIKFGSSKEK